MKPAKSLPSIPKKLALLLGRSEQSIREGQGLPSREFWKMVDASSSKPKKGRRTPETRQAKAKS